MRTTVLATLSLALLAAACSSAPQEPTSGSPQPAAPHAAAAATRPGYVHALAHSRFDVGASSAERLERGARKIVGQAGVFATRPTGLTLGISNADAPVRRLAPFAGGAASHDAEVRAYFIGAGLPQDQILDVAPYAVVNKVARVGEDLESLHGTKLAYYFSTVSRQIDGVEIADSFAWARLAEDGSPVLESVYWPDIPADVVREAVALKAKLADETFRVAFEAKVPRPGQLVIHHTPGEWDGAFSATASYDVAEETGKVTHFDGEGRRIELAHEAADAWGDHWRMVTQRK